MQSMHSTGELTRIPQQRIRWRDRLFRPNRWRLWIQFALLGAFILIIPILLTSYQLLDKSRQVLVEHEIIDLSDEANLRVNEMREDMAYLARDVRGESIKLDQANPGEAARALLENIALPDEPVEGAPESIRDSRRKLLHGCAVGVYVMKLNADGTVSLVATAPAKGEPATASPARQAVVMNALRDLAGRLKRAEPVNRSAMFLQPAGDGKPPRAILAFGPQKLPAGESPVANVFILDFSHYIWNRQRTSPRHFYFVTDPAGQTMICPQIDPSHFGQPLANIAPWPYPSDESGSWFNLSPDPKTRQKRIASIVNGGGARLEAVEIPALAYLYRKGTFPEGIPLAKILPDASSAAKAARELNEILRKEMATDTELRCGELAPAFGYVEVSHPNEKKLLAICDKIDTWLGKYTAGHKARWTKPLKCHTFQGQLVPLRVDLNDQDDPAWLVVSSSVEELREDIDDRFGYVYRVWVVPTLCIAILLGITLVVTLTFSLGKLAKAAQRLSDDKPVFIPLGGPYEVGQLAQTLDDLARKVQIRDRELRERAARYETILRAAGEGIVICSSDGLIEEANKAAGKMFGYTSAEHLIGLPVSKLVVNPVSLTSPADASSSVPQITSFGNSTDSIQGRRKDGSEFWLEFNLRPVTLKDRVVITCVFRDITIRKEAEDRIKKMNDELESRVRLRTAELEEANSKLDVALKQAESAARAKDVFVANMSHELRQPLNIITGFTQVLIEEANDLGAQEIVPDLHKILSAANHLLELINDILDLAKISAGRMELNLAEFDVSKLIGDVQTLVGPLAEKNHNAFQVEPALDLGKMTADERRVRQILINLLSNAFKFTEQGTVTLRVEKVHEESRDWFRFIVRDTGKGMTAQQLARLFQRFYQADDSTTRAQSGTGLGLAITQSFSEVMGGPPIRVSSQPGRGSEFIVTLPAVVTESSKPTGYSQSHTTPIPPLPVLPPAVSEEAEGRTVLVIEDDSMIRELMSRFLQKEGFRVVQAKDGSEGVQKAKEVHPCVITLDVMMPEADGWTVLSTLKSDRETCDIPVVMLTIVDDRSKGFALGAADYLTKPIDWQRLGTILRKYLSPGHGEKVLVIDDDPENREIIRRAVERAGCVTIEAEDGECGLRAFAEDRPALVLLDLMMPVLDGFGFLDELSKRFPAHRVPVVVLTAKDLTPEDFDRLNGRVARILEKGNLKNMDKLLEFVRKYAKATEESDAEGSDRR